jgi:superfamily II DNA/RNA helicase
MVLEPEFLCIDNILFFPTLWLSRSVQILHILGQGFRFHGLPDLRTCLAIGGVPTSEAMDVVKRGVHILVATPGRLMDMLNKKMITLDVCR